MAEFLKKTVKPSGGDYTSLEACMNANEQDLTGDGWFTVEIDGSWSSADTTAVTIHNYTTTASDYINVYTTSTARHDGRANLVSEKDSYRIDLNGSGNPIIIETSYVIIDGLEITRWNYGDAVYVGSSKDGCVIKNNIIHSPLSQRRGIAYYGGNSVNHKMYNNILYGDTNIEVSGSGWEIYNNTVYGYGGTAFNRGSGTPILKNNIGNGNDIDFSGGWGESATNISEDATSPDGASYQGANGIAVFVSTTAGSEDFHLASNDTKAINRGTDLSATFTTDIDGQTRPTGAGTWSIGADEYVAEANYSMGNYSSLPTDDANLENIYTAQNITDVATNDTNRVSQGANSGDYAIHQYKNVVGKQTILNWDGQCSLAPASSPVYLQIYNRSGTPAWETLDSKSTGVADSDFTLTATINDTTNYRDGSGVICCRIYQRNI